MSAPYLSVIVPAYNCPVTLERVLGAIAASDLPRGEWELIVADDGSTDSTPSVAARMADAVVRVANGPRGPGRARNEGASSAAGEVLVFVDADVCVSRTALSQFAALFRARPALGAVFGAYDATPEAPGLVSQYRNLLHHYVHSMSAGAAVTFWAGCGAVRRTAFVAANGFDAERYRRPQIEDIELGYRLSAMGWPIVLVPEITGTHLKRWTFTGGVITDFRDRGVPWMQLILERKEVAAAGPLNLARREKVFTVIAPLGVAAAVAAVVFRSWLPGAIALVVFASIMAGNARLLAWFARVRGVGFAVMVMPLRLAYYTLNAVSAGWAVLGHLRHSDSTDAPRGDRFQPSRASS